MRQLVTRQHNLGPWLGALKMQSVRAQFYLALPQLPVVIIAATPQIQKWFPWLSFWFILVGVALYYVVIGMWLDYVLVLPSETGYNNKQAYKHENPYVRDMKVLLKEREVFRRYRRFLHHTRQTRLGRIERKLGIEEKMP